MQVYQGEMGVFMGVGRKSKTEDKEGVSMVAKGKSEVGKMGRIHSNDFPSLR